MRRTRYGCAVLGASLALSCGAAAQTLDTSPTGSVLERVLGTATASAAGLDAVNGVFLNVSDAIGPRIDGSVTAAFDRARDVVNLYEASVQPDGSGASRRIVEPIVSSLGDVSTTALGAVNTGETTLGANQRVIISRTAAQETVNATLDQIGGSRETQALVGNLAASVADITGAVSITANDVNLSSGKVSTTALGAVNTGVIVSGVNARLEGTVESVAGAPD